MTQKKLRIIILMALIIIGAYLFYNHLEYSKEHRLYDEDHLTPIASTYLNSDTGETVHIDENSTYITLDDRVYVIDNSRLFDLLDPYQSVRSKKDYFPYESKKIELAFSINLNNKPRYFLLGEFCVWYEDDRVYDIIDGPKLLEELTKLIEDSN